MQRILKEIQREFAGSCRSGAAWARAAALPPVRYITLHSNQSLVGGGASGAKESGLIHHHL